MIFTAQKILRVMLPMAMILIASHVWAQEHSPGAKASDAKQESPIAAPDLADIIPSAAKLAFRLTTLENRIEAGLDVSAIGEKFDKIESNLEGLADQLQRLRDLKDFKYQKLVELRHAITRESELFGKTSNILSQAIRQLDDWRKEWLAEQKRWNEWQSTLLKEEKLDQLKLTFEKTNAVIDTALDLVLQRLEAMLTLQEKAGNILAKIDALAAEIDGLIVDERRGSLLDESPPMFSPQYFSQFKSGALWYAVQTGLHEISSPDSQFFHRQGWFIIFQVLFSFFVITALYRNRRILKESTRWCFLAARPYSAAFFLSAAIAVLIYEYVEAPDIWQLANAMIAGVSFARLSGGLVEASWKRQFVYGLLIVVIANRVLAILSFPLPLYRLYTLLAALGGFLSCLHWAGESVRHKDSALYTWSLRVGSLFFAVIIIAELWGKQSLASYLFVSLMRSMGIVLAFMLLTYMIRGGVEWIFRSAPLRLAAVPPSDDTDAIIRRMSRFVGIAIWGLVLLPGILMIWGAFDSLEGAMKGVLALGFNLGTKRISVGLLIVSAAILYGSFLASWVLEKLLMDQVLFKSRMETGVRHSIARLFHYVIIFAGFLFALSTLGFEVTQFTIMLSALGVGIGFGLQGIVNNFICGLILLFERPVRVGDYIEFDGKWAEIERIGLRATTVQTFDQADVIIPNADLINNPVTNWTLSNRRVRLSISVGVAYGSDVSLVMKTLMACANAHSKVAKTPMPQVLFLNFGESSLDFELRAWVWDAGERLTATSELHQEIERKFREAKIEIAFPQLDLHLRSVDESDILRPRK